MLRRPLVMKSMKVVVMLIATMRWEFLVSAMELVMAMVMVMMVDVLF